MKNNIEYRKIKDLKLLENNPRKISKIINGNTSLVYTDGKRGQPITLLIAGQKQQYRKIR